MTEQADCAIESVNQKAVSRVKRQMPKAGIVARTANLFRVLGVPTRVKLLYALSLEELCVCDLTALVDMSHSAVSHQLGVLRAANLVSFRREGKSVYYSLADEHVIRLMKIGVEHAKE